MICNMMENPVKGQECCMCGDHGFSDQLFRCKFCRFRSQHRYCSNLYPKADPDGVCNWCLSKRNSDETLVIRPSNSLLELPCKKRSGEDKEGEMKKMNREDESRLSQRLPERKKKRRRIITKGELEEKIKVRRSKSEEMMMVIKVRNKVRRYKLLDEVAQLN